MPGVSAAKERTALEKVQKHSSKVKTCKKNDFVKR